MDDYKKEIIAIIETVEDEILLEYILELLRTW